MVGSRIGFHQGFIYRKSERSILTRIVSSGLSALRYFSSISKSESSLLLHQAWASA